MDRFTKQTSDSRVVGERTDDTSSLDGDDLDLPTRTITEPLRPTQSNTKNAASSPPPRATRRHWMVMIWIFPPTPLQNLPAPLPTQSTTNNAAYSRPAATATREPARPTVQQPRPPAGFLPRCKDQSDSVRGARRDNNMLATELYAHLIADEDQGGSAAMAAVVVAQEAQAVAMYLPNTKNQCRSLRQSALPLADAILIEDNNVENAAAAESDSNSHTSRLNTERERYL